MEPRPAAFGPVVGFRGVFILFVRLPAIRQKGDFPWEGVKVHEYTHQDHFRKGAEGIHSARQKGDKRRIPKEKGQPAFELYTVEGRHQGRAGEGSGSKDRCGSAHALHQNGHEYAFRFISQTTKMFTGVEIHPGATIGKGLFIDHGTGVVIGETAVIGDNCTLYQGVTLGGTGKETGKRHPTLGNNVMVGAGAKVLGPVKVGNNCKIAAGAIVLTDIPDNCTAVGVPAKVVRRDNLRVDDLDQIHIPDPVDRELSALRTELKTLSARLQELEKTKKNESEGE